MVKYLHDAALQEVTAALTEVTVGGRLLNARLEAYTMKRAGTDKKYASQLQLRHTDQLESWQEQLAALASATATTATTTTGGEEPPWKRQRSVSTGDETPAAATTSKLFHSAPDAAASQLMASTAPAASNHRSRPRSNSLDAVLPSRSRQPAANKPHSASQQPPQHVLNRRLLTDLILTLNQAFPDYDFAAAAADDFRPVPPAAAVARINERLSEVATAAAAVGGGNNNNGASNHRSSTNLLPQLWAAVDGAIQLRPQQQQQAHQHAAAAAAAAVQIYEYVASDDCSFPQRSDDGGGDDDVLWSFHYLFVNWQLKRILLFTCAETIDNHDAGGGGGFGNNTSADGLLPVVRDADYEDYDDNDGDIVRQRKFSRRESDASARSRASRGAESSEGIVAMETIADDDDDDYDYGGGGGDHDNDDSSSNDRSVDFDLDPADAVSGGIPVDRV